MLDEEPNSALSIFKFVFHIFLELLISALLDFSPSIQQQQQQDETLNIFRLGIFDLLESNYSNALFCARLSHQVATMCTYVGVRVRTDVNLSVAVIMSTRNKYWDQGSQIYASYVHHTHMHQDQGSRILITFMQIAKDQGT